MPLPHRKILIIRHGALGDFICTLGAFKAIRQAHPRAEITLLTSQPYVELARATGYFDQIAIDNRLRPWHLWTHIKLYKWFTRQQFDRVYDLQTSNRTAMYFKLLGQKYRPEWSGIAVGCSHPQIHPLRKKMHIFDRFVDQLTQAGIPNVPYPDLDWAPDSADRFALPAHFMLIIPGCSLKADYKRWPAAYYGALAQQMASLGYATVMIGGPDDIQVTTEVSLTNPHIINLAGKTTILDLMGIARRAALIVGNDTGPVHIAAATRQPTLMLFSGQHDTQRIVPPYPKTSHVEHNPLKDLSVEIVIERAREMVEG